MKAVIQIKECTVPYNIHPRKLKRHNQRKQRRQNRQSLRQEDWDDSSKHSEQASQDTVR
jgi:hypothetical protein